MAKKLLKGHRRPARAPLPDMIPGEMLVLTHDRDGDDYTMIVDDGAGSSYKLGVDVQNIMRYFARVGIKDQGDRAIDIAHEYGIACATLDPADQRVFPVKAADPNWKPADLFADRKPKFAPLPSLS